MSLSKLSSLPTAGVVVIFIIIAVFALAVVLLFYVYGRYKYLAHSVATDPDVSSGFLLYAYDAYCDAYERFGSDTNTPAIVSDAVSTKLSGLLLIERFLNNAVSLMVTLGLFGTFLGLSLSVSSLTELIGYSNTTEWLSVLDNVGEGLMSSLSGMGVAFYTSLVGVAGSILLTLLRSIVSPAASRELMETRMELWLDESIAPTLRTKAANSDVQLVHQMMDAMQTASKAMEKSLKDATAALQFSLKEFDGSVESFNNGVHDFSEMNYNLHGTIERFDLAVRDYTNAFARSSAAGKHAASQSSSNAASQSGSNAARQE